MLKSSLLSGERISIDDRAPLFVPAGPSMMVHTLVSTLSALVMLSLACMLRPDRARRHALLRDGLGPPVAVVRSVLVPMAYGVVPTADGTTAETAELTAASQDEEDPYSPIVIGENIGLLPDATGPAAAAAVPVAARPPPAGPVADVEMART